ncbi:MULTISPECIES: hypothetical protein [unclassified Streptomyces]|uniref:hypothetical protein n=1 Tax=unclassified Streptomyces TaxID=2593676 RepID=UPI00278C2A1A|nr:MULTISPECIES: hypothetical protein [unclassified Streptomyces]
MNQSVRRAPWRAVRKSALALACATAVVVTGLPAAAGPAQAAPAPLKPGKRCDELHGLKSDGLRAKPLPPGDASRAKDQWDRYQYVNPAMAFDGLRPTAAQIKAAGDKYKKYGHNDPRRIYARFNKQNRWKNFADYLTKQYIPNHGNDPRGAAFERKVVKDMGLVGPDWICQKEVYFKDFRTGKRYKRVLDAYNRTTREIVEIKSNGKPSPKQIPADKAWARHPGWRQYKYTFVFGEKQTSEGTRFMKSMKRLAGARRVREYNFHSDHVPRAPKWAEKGPYRKNSPLMSLGNGVNTGSRGGGNDIIGQSPNTAKEWKRQSSLIRSGDTGGRLPKGPGGVDFTSLDLRYIGKPVKGKGLNYAFSARQLPDENQGGWGAQPRARLISDAFFTWLALTPDKFWVNLNPDQPDRVMDDTFASTDAGRVLLESDLRMKHDFFKAMDPKTDLGRRFWASLPRQNGRPCFAGIRNWIEPETATVREQDSGVHILDTPLKLKSTTQDFATRPGGGEEICRPGELQRRQAQAVIERMIVPAVEKTINTAPQYADLRRVYTARVAAEWIRQQDAKSPTDYHKLINSNDVKRWQLRAPHENWDKDALFKKYRKIFTEGEFRYNVDTARGVLVYIVGGVDFSKQPKRNMNGLRFQVEHRYAPRTAKIAVDAMTDDADKDGFVMLGGNTAGESTGTPPPTGPRPTPAPTRSAKPAPPAEHTPTPAPSTPAPGHDQPSAPSGKHDGNGGLANTGTQIGLVSALAAALLAAGLILARVKRRRDAQG